MNKPGRLLSIRIALAVFWLALSFMNTSDAAFGGRETPIHPVYPRTDYPVRYIDLDADDQGPVKQSDKLREDDETPKVKQNNSGTHSEEYYGVISSLVSKSKSNRSTELADPAFQGLRIKLADDPTYDGYIIKIAEKVLAPLKTPFDLDNLFIISALRDIGSTEGYLNNIPTDIRKRSSAMNLAMKESKGDKNAIYHSLRQIPAGSVVIIVGHVNEQTASFSIETTGPALEITATELKRFATQSKLNLLLMGCNSSLLNPIGTIHLIDSIELFKDLGVFLQPVENEQAHKMKSNLYTALAISTGGLLINPFEFELFGITHTVDSEGRTTASSLIFVNPNECANGEPREYKCAN
jgi:hypothetical protein